MIVPIGTPYRRPLSIQLALGTLYGVLGSCCLLFGACLWALWNLEALAPLWLY